MSDTPSTLRLLFLCTGNSARSQIAEALLVQKGQGRFEVASAGTDPAPGIHPQTIVALAELGIDWSSRRPKGLESVSSEPWDIIITTCDKIRESCPSFPGQPVYAHWSIADPAQAGPTELERVFRETVVLLKRRIDLMLAVRLDQKSRAELQESIRMTETGAHRVPARTGSSGSVP